MGLRGLTVFLLLMIGVRPNIGNSGNPQTDRRSKISETNGILSEGILSEASNTLNTLEEKKETLEENADQTIIEKENGDIPEGERSFGSKAKRKTDASDVPHSRQKRLLWITNDGRLALPPGTSLVITPTLSMPFIRHPPEGFFSNLTISVPLTVDFDKLGLTDNENPYGALPPIFSRSIGKAAGGLVADFVGKYLDRRRGKRSAGEDIPPQVQEKFMHILHGGERAILFGAVEDLLVNFGMEGKPCLLRAICEVHAHPLSNFGLLGEMLKLFFTASKSPYSALLQEYVEAERAGGGDAGGPGECWPYFKGCPKSLFLPKKNKYARDAEKEHLEEDNHTHDDEDNSEMTKLTIDKNFNEINDIDIQQM